MDPRTLSKPLGLSEFKAWCKARRGTYRNDLNAHRAAEDCLQGSVPAKEVVDRYKAELVKLRLTK